MLEISRHATRPGVFTLRDEVWLPREITEVFGFFSDAYRLQEITPGWLHFHVQTPRPIEMKPGTLIDYRLRLHGIPIGWRTEISDWEPPFRFVDQQLSGPYRLWRHTHLFEERDGGTLMRDHVDYSVPGGAIVHRLLVKNDLLRIFRFRRQKFVEFFSDPNAAEHLTDPEWQNSAGPPVAGT